MIKPPSKVINFEFGLFASEKVWKVFDDVFTKLLNPSLLFTKLLCLCVGQWVPSKNDNQIFFYSFFLYILFEN